MEGRPTEDTELVERAKHGDQDAYADLVTRYQSIAARTAYVITGTQIDAEDAAQEAFLTAYRRLDGFRGDASFKTWVLTIAWHQAINQRRRLARWWRLFGQSRGKGGRGQLRR